METTGEDFKISNEYIAFYARLWKARHPEHKDLFNIKKMIGEPTEGQHEQRKRYCLRYRKGQNLS